MCVRVVFVGLLLSVFFFFKQKTAYEMRISDWSSDVCSSDLVLQDAHALDLARDTPATAMARMQQLDRDALHVLDDGRLAGIVTYRGLARLAAGVGNDGGAGKDEGLAGALIRDVPTAPCDRSEEHTSELQSLMRTSYAVFCLKK